MPQTAATMSGVLKEAWSADRLQKQFEDKNMPLGRLEARRGVVMGRQVQTPILSGRSGAYTSVGAGGGALNPAINQPTAQALWTFPYSWFQIELEASALIQSGGNLQSVVGGKDLEIQGAVENTRHQMSRQIVTGGDGIVAALATNASTTTPLLVAAAAEGGGSNYGYSALMRGWIQSNFPVDIGTTADTDALGTGVVIQAVSKNAAAPSITLSAAIVTTAGTHFIYIPNPNSATAPNPEMNGVRQIVGTGALGGLNPASAGYDFWQGAALDTTTTTFSLDLVLNLQRLVLQNSNAPGNAVWTSYKQQANFYSLLQNQVQFAGDQNLAAGAVSSPKWNGMAVDAFADVLDTDWFMLTLDDIFRVIGNVSQPQWASDIEGSGGATRWRQGYTSFVDALVYPVNVGVQRRNTHAAAINLK